MRKTICPDCEGKGFRLNWLPEPGTNPLLRKYECSDCHHTFFAETGLHPLIRRAEGKNRPSEQLTFLPTQPARHRIQI